MPTAATDPRLAHTLPGDGGLSCLPIFLRRSPPSRSRFGDKLFQPLPSLERSIMAQRTGTQPGCAANIAFAPADLTVALSGQLTNTLMFIDYM